MRLQHRLALAITLLFAAMTQPAQAQAPSPAGVPTPAPSSGPVYIVTYFEVAAPAAGKTLELLRQFAAATRKKAGNAGFLSLEELSRPASHKNLPRSNPDALKFRSRKTVCLSDRHPRLSLPNRAGGAATSSLAWLLCYVSLVC